MNTIPESVSSSVTSTASMQPFQNDRKRRDNINDRIQELLALIPKEFFTDYYNSINSGESTSGETPGSASTPRPKGTGTRDGKPNKGQILTQAVEYITFLQNEVDKRNREEVEMILKIQKLARMVNKSIDDVNLENTSAEVELSKIGVGPLANVVSSNTIDDAPTRDSSNN
ncbi:Rtg1p NDAI_0A06760 [Naumovozyma dairenensis CBS 421]|uniref:BHLH domain-containing protein n=1 Tax=Naumovozyma dairenensis (strain ATCC 10597 / BCRC 20456 / CBS 421 / NBRC 0211 / NRRL Y-12639) TaxID=1071378 RepID=G0W4U2_NAUDC|nr:hypothetical protein NDAI_0A06760 [Naumovozyma dairenensis CBS 421]CCD22830.1 hypothetical protein NDAI_0A06760 [Naumovozyma dairenensis CBS 421]